MKKKNSIVKNITWKRFLISFSILFIISAVYIFWPTKIDLAHLEIPEGKYDVRILRDSYGVPHIYGEKDSDVAFGLAFAHSEDDFRTIQQSIIAAKGMMGQVYGIDAAAIDYLTALLRVQDVVDA
ncbi:MAG: hypothetical protein HON98_11105 [Chloroflexi bacterium]|jgi:acyl-homoserine-lactone acylase|nr:hypothetical protein [Chloroflexota bacterium]MBT4004291.1 hypothetical protein [Chloroflexota bacterium]MBT4305712.1 hypothetical protein [Chloroflexota bacterium]MBT4533536.1 hypothetical protein [Chloroflexota bacterium]MBT4681821.1 hypothetical protein [Chloroflexota bacterium]